MTRAHVGQSISTGGYRPSPSLASSPSRQPVSPLASPSRRPISPLASRTATPLRDAGHFSPTRTQPREPNTPTPSTSRGLEGRLANARGSSQLGLTGPLTGGYYLINSTNMSEAKWLKLGARPHVPDNAEEYLVLLKGARPGIYTSVEDMFEQSPITSGHYNIYQTPDRNLAYRIFAESFMAGDVVIQPIEGGDLAFYPELSF
ncbi:hypothetical protein BJ165DRAFT_641802 [Panaeolus papilionaceus]|nr:hypothetical protein BJ165DRAFT_641802 [Panaeolus papilionaceus]